MQFTRSVSWLVVRHTAPAPQNSRVLQALRSWKFAKGAGRCGGVAPADCAQKHEGGGRQVLPPSLSSGDPPGFPLLPNPPRGHLVRAVLCLKVL